MATEACTSSSISVRGMKISLITPSAVSHHVAGARHPPAREGFCLFRFSLILLFSFILHPPPLQTTSVQEEIATHWPTNSKQGKSEALGWGIVPCCHALLLPGICFLLFIRVVCKDKRHFCYCSYLRDVNKPIALSIQLYLALYGYKPYAGTSGWVFWLWTTKELYLTQICFKIFWR